MKKILLIVILAVVTNLVQAQGINFLNGSFKDAQAKAKAENKILFVDCYASWCGPCKIMDQKVFPDLAVSSYANEKFVSYKLDVEAPENKKTVIEYKVTSMPTFLFISPDGKVINKKIGASDIENFIRLMKVATGDAPSFFQLYDKLGKAEDVDGVLTRQFLLLAPREIGSFSKEDQLKWGARVNSTFSKYVKSKPMEKLINKEDFMIVSTFNVVTDDNELFKFMCRNYSKYKEVFGDITPAKYIIPTHINMMLSLAKKGDKKYLAELERLNGDMKDIYAEVKSAVSTDIYSMQKHSLDAAYIIYSKKDVSAYMELMDSYFKTVGTEVSANDYAKAAADLYTAMEGKLPNSAYGKCAEWLTMALDSELPVKKQIQYLVMLADCHKSLKEIDKAKGLYSRAYILAMQIGDKRTQFMIKSLLAKLSQ